MKAISLWQPWATLIALGVKRWETRGWETKFRGRLAIHAAQKWSGELQDVCNQWPFEDALVDYQTRFDRWQHDLPRGAIVAVCDLTDCIATLDCRELIGQQEEAFGDYGPGRFALKLENVQRIEPIRWKGRQGFFEVTLPVRDAAAPFLLRRAGLDDPEGGEGGGY